MRNNVHPYTETTEILREGNEWSIGTLTRTPKGHAGSYAVWIRTETGVTCLAEDGEVFGTEECVMVCRDGWQPATPRVWEVAQKWGGWIDPDLLVWDEESYAYTVSASTWECIMDEEGDAITGCP